jgi:hypothetical protein
MSHAERSRTTYKEQNYQKEKINRQKVRTKVLFLPLTCKYFENRKINFCLASLHSNTVHKLFIICSLFVTKKGQV